MGLKLSIIVTGADPERVLKEPYVVEEELIEAFKKYKPDILFYSSLGFVMPAFAGMTRILTVKFKPPSQARRLA